MALQPKKSRPETTSGDSHSALSDGPATGAEADIGLSQGQGAQKSAEAGGASKLQTMLADAFDSRLRVAPLIEEEVEDEEDDDTFAVPIEPDAEATRRAATARNNAKWRGRIIKSLIGLALLVFAMWVPARQLFQVASAEAVVNAQIVTMRAPIEGIVDVATGIPAIGVELGQNAGLLQIVNPRADRQRLNDATRAVEVSLDQREALTAELRSRRAQQADLTAQVEDFRAARIEYLTALLTIPAGALIKLGDRDERVPLLRERLGMINPDNNTALVYDAALEAAVMAFQWSAWMTPDGIVGPATIAALNGELNPDPAKSYATVIELDALRRGVFVGDSYNDRPSSAQRLETLAIEIASLESQLAINVAGYQRLVDIETRERAWVDQMSDAAITAPVDGRVWEVLTAPGEQVVIGQELVRMLDCANPLVTAAVSEAVYNQLSVGMAAKFTFREGGEAMSGEVVQLTGFASAPANLAITPASLRAESYRVTVAVPQIAAGDGCAVGRTGRVVFDVGR
jgi:HlyD family secretion protein/Putative peptidoglycan binding domain